MSDRRKTILVLSGLAIIIVVIYLVGGNTGPSPAMTTKNRLRNLKPVIVDWVREKGSPPAALSDLGLPMEAITDHTGTPFVYNLQGTQITISWLGADGKPGGHMFKADHSVTFDYTQTEE